MSEVIDPKDIDVSELGVAYMDDKTSDLKVGTEVLSYEVRHIIGASEPADIVMQIQAAKAEGQETDVVLLDGRRGNEVPYDYTQEGIEALRQAGLLGQVGVVLMSGDLKHIPVPADIMANVDATEEKPFDVDRLLNAIAVAAAKARARRASDQHQTD